VGGMDGSILTSQAMAALTAGMELALLLVAVPVAAIAVTGLLTSLLQAITQLQDSSLAFVPKLAVGALAIWVAGPWMLTLLGQFAQALWLRGGVG
jgi:flagellar biosynthetic protein FliQ